MSLKDQGTTRINDRAVKSAKKPIKQTILSRAINAITASFRSK